MRANFIEAIYVCLEISLVKAPPPLKNKPFSNPPNLRLIHIRHQAEIQLIVANSKEGLEIHTKVPWLRNIA